VYSDGAAEEVLGQALRGRRDDVLISTKASLPTGPDDWGSSRPRLLRAVDRALRRLQTDHIDVFQLHGFDAYTPSMRCCRRWKCSSSRARCATRAYPTSRAGS
jgi:aryl-alcohol dehydrogenase-like predicted oxidoreductase